LELLLLLLLIANKIRRKKVSDAADKGGGGRALNWKRTPRGVRFFFSVPLRDRRLFKKRGLGKG
jgi:Zn/Cd-binding protein ZinT